MTTLTQLVGISELLEAAGKSITSFVDGLKHLVTVGKDGIDAITAKRTKDRLSDIAARSVFLLETQKAGFVGCIDVYLDDPHAGNWARVTCGMKEIVIEVQHLLADLKQERSDLVLENVYQQLVSTLTQRALLLQKVGDMASIAPPSSPEELRQLDEINTKYKALLGGLYEAVAELDKYIKGSSEAHNAAQFSEKQSI